jgi:hypothetical protein
MAFFQGLPMLKNQTDVIAAFEYGLKLYYDQDYIDGYKKTISDFIQKYFNNKKIDELAAELISREIFVLDLSLIYIYFLKFCQAHEHLEEITEVVNGRIENLFDHMGYSFDLKNIFHKRKRQYENAFESDNNIQAIAKMLQFIIDKILYSPEYSSYLEATMSDTLWMTAADWDPGNMNCFLECLTHIKKTIFRKALPLKGNLSKSTESPFPLA